MAASVIRPCKDAQEFLTKVRSCMNEIKVNFVAIGAYLSDANTHFLYQRLGYSSIIECAASEFGIEKTTCYDLINLYRRFGNPYAIELQPQYAHCSQSQLIAMLGFGATTMNYILPRIDSKTTVKDIKRAGKLIGSVSPNSLVQGSYYQCESVRDFISMVDGSSEFSSESSSESSSDDISGRPEKKKKINGVDAFQKVRDYLAKEFKDRFDIIDVGASVNIASHIVYEVLEL